MVNASDHRSLIKLLGGGAKVAAAIGEQPVTVRAMGIRNRIPPEHWPALIAMADAQDVALTAEWLMQTTPPRVRQAA